MKTKLIAFIIIILAFSSCNTAKHYANYRFGGKTKQESKTLLEETKTEEVSEQIQEEKSDTLFRHTQKDSSTIESVSFKVDKKTIIKTEKTVKSIENKNPEKKEKFLVKEKSEKKTFQVASNRKNSPIPKSSLKGYGFDSDDLLYTLAVIAIIALGAYSLYLLGVTFLEILTFVGAMLLVVFLLSLLGKAIMSIFPGMQKGKSIPKILEILKKPIIKTKSAVKSYDGISIGLYFLLGLLVIGVAGLFTLLFFTWLDAVLLMTVLLAIHLGILAMLGIGYALVYICTGGMMSIKKKSKIINSMKSSDAHYLKYILGGILIAGVLLFLTGNWPIAIAFLSAVVLCKLVELIIDFFEGRAFGKMIGNLFSPKKGHVKSNQFPASIKKFLSGIFRLIKRFFAKDQLSTKEYFQLYFIFVFSIFLLLLLISTPAIALDVLWIFTAFILCILLIAGLHYLIGFIFPNNI